MSDETGRDEIYVQPFLGLGAKVQISTDGGKYPRWSSKGGELFYQLETGTSVRLMAVAYRVDEDGFHPARPRELFRGPYAVGPRAEYDVAPNGESFVMLRREDTNATPLVFVVNWHEELRRLVPTDGAP